MDSKQVQEIVSIVKAGIEASSGDAILRIVAQALMQSYAETSIGKPGRLLDLGNGLIELLGKEY